MKKRKCLQKMAQGGAVYPQERPVQPPKEPEWKQTLAAIKASIVGNDKPKEKPPTGNTIAETAGTIVNRNVDNMDAMKRAGYYDGGIPGQDLGTFGLGNETVLQRMDAAKQLALNNGMDEKAYDASLIKSPTPLGNVFSNPSAGNVLHPNAGMALTMADKDKALGLDPNRAYQAGSPMDPHSGIYQAAAQKIASSPAPLPTNNPVQMPQIPEFQSRRQQRRGMAGGGKIDPEELMRRMSEKYDAPQPEPKQPEPPTQQIANPPVQTSPVQKAESLVDTIRMREEELKKAANYESGGIPGGMTIFKGKGGPRDDKIPVTVAGEKINVSNDEAGLILPAKTAQNPQALAQIAQTIQQSNDGRKPKMGIEAGGKYADGLLDKVKKYYADTGLVPNDSMTYQQAKQGPWPGVADVERGTFEDVQKAKAAGDYATAAGQAFRGAAALVPAAVSDLAGQVERNPVARGISTFITGEPSSKQPQQGMAQVAQKQPMSEAAKSVPVVQQPVQEQAIAQNTFQAPANAVTDAQGNKHFTQPGFDPTQHKFAQGTGAVTGAGGRTIMVDSPDYYTAADGSKTTDWSKTRDYADAIARNERTKEWLASIEAGRQGRDPTQTLATQQGMAIAAQKAPLERQLTQQQIAQTQGGLADAANVRNARDLLTAAYNSGDPATIAKAERQAIAHGILKPPAPPKYEMKPGAMGGVISMNENTGEGVMVSPEGVPTRFGAPAQQATKTITKAMQADLVPDLKKRGVTLEQYARQHGYTIEK